MDPRSSLKPWKNDLRRCPMRVLDLGCGFGNDIAITKLPELAELVGVDIDLGPLELAAKRFPARTFIEARAERLPFRNGVFHSIVCQLAMPYMNIPVALNEINRVLTPGGTVHLSLHAFRFTIHELTVAFPRPKALLFRTWVMANGLISHITGKPLGIAGRYESFQTRRGMSLALRRSGFDEITFTRPRDAFTRKLIVSAHKREVEATPEALAA